MKKLFTILAVALCSTLAMAQTNQYFWAGGQFIIGNPIGQIDSVTFGELEQTDSVLLYLPHTVKVVHDTVIKYVTIHDTINPCAVPDGAISGKFSVSPTKQVYFSQGNLQYQASTDTWRFAENQYDFIGADNANISSTYNGWIDLFGWGTGNCPTNCSIDNSLYTTFVDFGNNTISNGNGDWYTMSKEEWVYLLYGRNNANMLKLGCTVNGKICLLLLPNDWETLSGINITIDTLGYSLNTFTLNQWQLLEQKGCVILPTVGWRNGQFVDQVGNSGSYLTSTPDDAPYSFELCIGESFMVDENRFCIVKSDGTSGDAGRFVGRAVRLVQEVK